MLNYRRKQMKFKSITVYLIALSLIASTVFIFAKQNGKVGRTVLGTANGCTCHGSTPSTDVAVVLAGPDSLAAGETGTFSVTISGGPLNAAGTNIAVSGGDLNTSGSDLRKESGELTHTAPKDPTQGKVTFDFTYTAPTSAGTVTMAANGNSVNKDGTSSNDKWNFAANHEIEVYTPNSITEENGAIARSFSLDQNYPNPFNPTTTIGFTLKKAAEVNLTVYNNAGKKVATLANGFLAAGDHKRQFIAQNFASGLYLYQLRVGEAVISKRMVLLK